MFSENEKGFQDEERPSFELASDALGKQAHYAEAMLTWESFGFPTKFNI